MSEHSHAIDTMHPAGRAGYGRPMRIIGDDVDEIEPEEQPAVECDPADESDAPSVGLFAGRLFVRDVRGAIVPVPLAQIERLAAQDDYVAVFTRERRYLIAARIADLAATLPPGRFLRLHRSHIVNLDFVERMVPFDSKRLQVELRDGTRLLASRSSSEMLRRQAR